MSLSFNPIALLNFALTKRYDSELNFLLDLQKNLSEWYNKLATPVLPILTAAYQSNDNVTIDVENIRKIAQKMYEEQIVHNQGNEIKNLLEQLPGRGIICIRDNAKLRQAVYDVLNSGDYLKQAVYLPSPNELSNIDDFKLYIRDIYKKFAKFQSRKEALEKLINKKIQWLR